MPRPEDTARASPQNYVPTPDLFNEIVGAVMRPASCAFPETSVDGLRLIFDDQRVGAVVVIDCERVPLGIITPRDLAQEIDDVLDDWGPMHQELGLHIAPPDRCANDVMMPLVFTVHAQTPVLVAARLMLYESVTHLPVVDRRRAVIGMVSAIDLVRHVMAHVTPM